MHVDDVASNTSIYDEVRETTGNYRSTVHKLS